MKKLFILFFIFVVVLIFQGCGINEASDPEEVIHILEKGILEARERGDYDCCIAPVCTMCYLGNWKFEKGTCYCDKAIEEGRMEDVCPQCIKGLDGGKCNSLDKEVCGV